jgi:hypothetical protein
MIAPCHQRAGRTGFSAGFALLGVIALMGGIALAGNAARADEAAPTGIAAGSGPPASVTVTNYRCHILPVMTASGQRDESVVRPACDLQATGPTGPNTTSCSTGGCGVVNYHGGPTLTQASETYYLLNCAGDFCFSTYGDPFGFSIDYFNSEFIHVIDQYITGSSKYSQAVGPYYWWIDQSTPHTITDAQLQAYIVDLIRYEYPIGGGGGYNAMYSMFLTQGQDICMNTVPPKIDSCYCPDSNCNGGMFAFCAYHGSFDTTDAVGNAIHVIYQAMPYQNVSGCQTIGGPNGTLTDSTANIFAHEITETITDPDLNAWYRDSDGSEIEDICYLARVNPIYLNGNAYDIQPIYSNAVQNCVGAYETVAHSHDFNSDGRSDIALSDTSGNLTLWLMQSANIATAAGYSVSPVWSIVGQRDFNGDRNADLLWRDTSGNIAMWSMNGTSISSTASIGNVSTVWSVAGTGDFNGDDKGDILWLDKSGNVAIWLMNGSTITSAVNLGNVGTSWQVVGTGDFNGDGKTDILWRDTSGNVAIWFMNGTSIEGASNVGNVSTIWSVAATGDFNGDGHADILWRDNSGNLAVWLMQGSEITTAVGLGTISTAWNKVGTGDFNADGKSDILWEDTSGDLAVWFMNGATISSAVSLGTVSNVWSIQTQGAE